MFFSGEEFFDSLDFNDIILNLLLELLPLLHCVLQVLVQVLKIVSVKL